MRGTGPAFIQLGRAVRYSRSALEDLQVSADPHLDLTAADAEPLSSPHVSPGEPELMSKSNVMNDKSIIIIRCTSQYIVRLARLGTYIRVKVSNILLTLSQNT